MQEKQYIAWDQVDEMCGELSRLIQCGIGDLKGFGIIPILRGGLIPAVILSHKLGLRIRPSSRDGDERSGWIVVDDICDTGKTFQETKLLYPNAYYACLIAKPEGFPHTHLLSRAVPQDVWIYWPWEDPSEKVGTRGQPLTQPTTNPDNQHVPRPLLLK